MEDSFVEELIKDEMIEEEVNGTVSEEAEKAAEEKEELSDEEKADIELKELVEGLPQSQKAPLIFATKNILNKKYTMLLISSGRYFNKLRLPTEYPALIPDDVFQPIVRAMATIFTDDAPAVFALRRDQGNDVDVVGFRKDEEGHFVFMTAEEAESAFKFKKGSMNVRFIDFEF